MKVVATAIPEVLILEPRVFADERGFFMESWNQQAFDQATGVATRFVQDNHSRSRRGVLRGLHYQRTKPQGKLVRATAGAVFDVAVDVRHGSPTLGRWVGVELSAENARQLWIPPGFAHGFVVLTETADFQYKATDYYAPHDERCIAWNDSSLAIEWPLPQRLLQLSAKDQQGCAWEHADLCEPLNAT